MFRYECFSLHNTKVPGFPGKESFTGGFLRSGTLMKLTDGSSFVPGPPFQVVHSVFTVLLKLAV